MNLYRLENGIHSDWYVIADHPTEAANMLESALNEEEYSFKEQRKVTAIFLVAEQIADGLNRKHFFSSGNKLLLKEPNK